MSFSVNCNIDNQTVNLNLSGWVGDRRQHFEVSSSDPYSLPLMVKEKYELYQKEEPLKNKGVKIKWKANKMPGFIDDKPFELDKDSKIIIVEDDVDAVFPVSKALKKFKSNISYCMSGTEALDVVPILMPDLIILDWHLGDMNADSVLKGLDKLLWLEGSKTVGLITYSTVDKEAIDLTPYLKFQHVDHWQKPLTMNQIKYKVRELSL